MSMRSQPTAQQQPAPAPSSCNTGAAHTSSTHRAVLEQQGGNLQHTQALRPQVGQLLAQELLVSLRYSMRECGLNAMNPLKPCAIAKEGSLAGKTNGHESMLGLLKSTYDACQLCADIPSFKFVCCLGHSMEPNG
eukprot:225876-Pelagomonas_calceolata.AAC.3